MLLFPSPFATVIFLGLGLFTNHVDALVSSSRRPLWSQFRLSNLLFGLKPQSYPDIYIAGCGRLGQYLCDRLVREGQKDGIQLSIVAETRSGLLKPISSVPFQESLAAVRVSRRGDRTLTSDSSTPFCANMVIAFPPYARGTNGGDGAQYLAEVEACIAAWKHNRPPPDWSGGDIMPGKLILVSSTGVYADNDDDLLTETTDLTPKSTYVAMLKAAEDMVLAAGGCVLRLGGLYDAESGPHRVYLTRLATVLAADADSPLSWNKSVSVGARLSSRAFSAGSGSEVGKKAFRNRLLRMVSYSDAAGMLCAILGLPEGATGSCSGASGRVFLGLGGQPTTGRELLEAALATDAGRQRLFELLPPPSAAAVPVDLSVAALGAAVDQVFDARIPDRHSATVRYDDSATRAALAMPHSRSRWPFRQQHGTVADYFRNM